MPVKPMCSRTGRANVGPVLTAEQLREICDRLTVLSIVLSDLDNRLTALEADTDVMAVAA